MVRPARGFVHGLPQNVTRGAKMLHCLSKDSAAVCVKQGK